MRINDDTGEKIRAENWDNKLECTERFVSFESSLLIVIPGTDRVDPRLSLSKSGFGFSGSRIDVRDVMIGLSRGFFHRSPQSTTPYARCVRPHPHRGAFLFDGARESRTTLAFLFAPHLPPRTTCRL